MFSFDVELAKGTVPKHVFLMAKSTIFKPLSVTLASYLIIISMLYLRLSPCQAPVEHLSIPNPKLSFIPVHIINYTRL